VILPCEVQLLLELLHVQEVFCSSNYNSANDILSIELKAELDNL